MSDYYRLIAASAILLALSIGWTIHKGEQLPEVTASASGPGLPLSGFVFDNAHLEGRRPVIVLAASGGGTRAALYTASVLEALASTGHASDVILGSGVSGGGAALAYFAGCRPGLLQKDDSARVRKWNQFFEAMQQPFIQDVLERASEWRMVTGGRLGFLLAESFERRWGLPPERQTLGGVKDFGLILNTALAGSFDIDDLPQQVQKLPLPDAERRFRDEYTRPELAGGRLILTNLAWDRAFTSEILEGYTRHPLPIVVNDPSVRLERAAALNANFPPVFSNAAVDVDRTRFWVTDGGAVDNRGMEMLLYAIRRSLDSGSAGVPRSRLPRMHVIVADASAFSNEFSQDRGVSTMTAAGTRFASQLAAELVRDIKRRYAERQQDGDFSFWYLMMPDELRVSTSFGTHWMLQSRITVCHRASPVKEITLTGSEVVEVLRSLYTGADRHLTDDAKTVLAWLQEKPSQWQLLASALRGPS